MRDTRHQLLSHQTQCCYITAIYSSTLVPREHHDMTEPTSPHSHFTPFPLHSKLICCESCNTCHVHSFWRAERHCTCPRQMHAHLNGTGPVTQTHTVPQNQVLAVNHEHKLVTLQSGAVLADVLEELSQVHNCMLDQTYMPIFTGLVG